MNQSEIARFGRSKEKRFDAKLIVLAVVVNQKAFLKYCNIFEGNTADNATLEIVIEDLSSHNTVQDLKPIVVMDAGIATDDNIKLIRAIGSDYLCVSRSNLKVYEAVTSRVTVMIKDKKLKPMELSEFMCTKCYLVYQW